MQRAFSSLEVIGYEWAIAAAVVEAAAPAVEQAVVGRRILDVGCGGGRLARRLGAIGVDAAALQARRAGGVQAVAGALPFATASFDSIVSCCSIKHWPDAASGIAECRRVTRPGGVVVVVEMDRFATIDEMRAFAALTRLPRLLHRLYASFDMRAVLPSALSADELASVVGAPAMKIDGQPFNIVTAYR